MRKRWSLVLLCLGLGALPLLGQNGIVMIEAEVDGSDYLLIQGNAIRVEHRSHEALTGLKSRFDPVAGLPSSPLEVTVAKLEGTGPVTVEEQPNAANNYTLKVLINNDNEAIYPQVYKFRLDWKAGSPTGAGDIDTTLNDTVHWRGEVDGTDLLRFQGEAVTVEHLRALPIQNQRCQFTAPLPAAETTVSLLMVQGRGKTEIVQQPAYGNNYTAVVRVDDGRFKSSAVYDFYLYWPKQTVAQTYAEGDMDYIWEGRVDGRDRIVIKGRSAQLEHLLSAPPTEVNQTMRKSLPRKEQTVSLYTFKGRGKIKLVEQPSSWNDYAVAVMVDDTEQGGSAVYRFGLRWEGGSAESSGSSSGSSPAASGSGVLRWQGQVDGRDRLRIRDKAVTVEHLEAGPIQGMNFLFSDPLPRRALTASLNVLQGRGSVNIIQQPSAQNNYELVVEINDSKGGSGLYEIEIYW